MCYNKFRSLSTKIRYKHNFWDIDWSLHEFSTRKVFNFADCTNPCRCEWETTRCMVLIVDGNSEIWCARTEKSLLFDLFQAFDKIEPSHKSDICLRKDLYSFKRAQYVLSYHLIYKYRGFDTKTSFRYIIFLHCSGHVEGHLLPTFCSLLAAYCRNT